MEHGIDGIFSALSLDDVSFATLSAALLWTSCIPLICVVVAVVATVLWRQYFMLSRDPNSSLPLPPGCMGFPIVGESLNFIASGSNFYLARRQKYGHIYKTHLLGHPTVRVIGNEYVKPILLGDHISVSVSWPKSTQLLLGPGSLSNACPSDHRNRKRLLLDALSPGSVAGFIPRIQEIMGSSVRKWCGQGEVMGLDSCKDLSIALATELVLGLQHSDQEIDVIVAALKISNANIFSLPWNIRGGGLWKGLKAREFVRKHIRTTLQMESHHLSIVENMKTIDVTVGDDVIDSILELWFAANDTTSSALCSAILALGRNEGIRAKILEELDGHGLLQQKGELTSDILTQLTYTGHVVKEILRLYPPVGGGFRKATKTMEIGGYQIPKGWKVIYSIRDTHQTTGLFDDLDNFNPERWQTMDSKIKANGQRFHYIPFGAGAHACPGSTLATVFLKVFLIELCRTSSWTLHNKDPEIQYLPCTRPVGGLPVKFSLRTEYC